MKRSSIDEHFDPAKSLRYDHALYGDLVKCLDRPRQEFCGNQAAELINPAFQAGPAQSLSVCQSDDTQIRGYLPDCDMPDVPVSCAAEEEVSLSSGPGHSMLSSPTPSPTPHVPFTSELDSEEPTLATASTGEVQTSKVNRCKRRVRFSPGPLERESNASGEGHPVSSQERQPRVGALPQFVTCHVHMPTISCAQVVRLANNPYTPITYHPTEALTRHNLTAMENELGEEFKAENAASLVRLRRRLGIVPMAAIPRPYVTFPKAQQGAP